MSDASSSDQRPRRVDGRQVAMAAAGVLLLWFVIGNWQSVRIHFWVTSAKAPLFIVILVAAALGGFVAWFLKRHGGNASDS